MAVSPGFTVTVVAVPDWTVSVNVLLEPVPVSGTECGLPGALSTIVMEPERAPATVGLNVTEIVQVPFAAMGEAVTHVVVSAKSPLGVTEVTVSGAVTCVRQGHGLRGRSSSDYLAGKRQACWR